MGGYAQGGSLAAPIYKQFFLDALADRQPVPFTAPKNIRMVRIDRRTGRRVYGSWPGSDPKAAIIWEAFKPESEPKRTIREEEIKPAKPAEQPDPPVEQRGRRRAPAYPPARGDILNRAGRPAPRAFPPAPPPPTPAPPAP